MDSVSRGQILNEVISLYPNPLEKFKTPSIFKNIESMIIKSCFHWSGHLVHTEAASFPKRFLFYGKRNPSKPLHRHKNYLKSYQVKGKNDAEDWELLAKDKNLGAVPFTWELKILKMNVCPSSNVLTACNYL